LIKPKGTFEDDRTDKSASIPSIFLQDVGQRDGRIWQCKTARVSNLIHIRICSCEHAGMRGKSQRRLGDCFFEQYTFVREIINSWSLDFVISVAVQMICSNRVQSDKDNIDRFRRLR